MKNLLIKNITSHQTFLAVAVAEVGNAGCLIYTRLNDHPIPFLCLPLLKKKLD